MSRGKMPVLLEFGEYAIVILRTPVLDSFDVDGVRTMVTEAGEYSEEDPELIAIYPDPKE